MKWVWHEAVWLKIRGRLAYNMQPAIEHSPWPKRILIAGFALGFIGVIALSFMLDDFTDYYDPREMSEHTFENSQTDPVLKLDSGCWVVNVEGDDSDYEVTFNYVVNGEAGEEVSDDCRSDFQPSSADVEFSTITKLDIEEDSEILIDIKCKEDGGCDEPLLFTNSEDVLLEMMGDTGLWLVASACCTATILIPLGWILISINRSKTGTVQLTQQQFVEQGIDPAFDQNQNMNQEIMTTDQLYRLVRGELPDSETPQSNVPSPFSDADTRVKSQPKKKTGGSINRASSYTHENPPTDESWKSWDES